ncbi:hypothetical protein ACWEGQ_00635 [Streptomyces seoulensis]
MTHSYADRMTANELTRGYTTLATDAHSIAEGLERFAKDVERGLRCGDINQLARQMQDLLVRAVQLDATRETAELYAADHTTEK